MTVTNVRPVQVGDELGPFVRETGFAAWNRFAAVNDEFVPIHMDDEAGKAAGQPGAFGMGNLQWSYLHNLVRDWAGEDARIVELSCQFRKPNLKGTVTARGIVTAVRDEADGQYAELDLWTVDESGAKLAPGKATVQLALHRS
ncbi:MaoC/PaaZ C-terminal domain-containing protein [Arthrobacter sp. AZCC_0090]|uniref:MaoC/PaaZ C-terminal domain-containing protein n=1 Tax=Arthrobacter sp. AZCC_0090 TaxID=2735881 RepID=UPI0016199583|nr:MaoC/PaaZ C-terminal domain-containing protein [Arthrobacter sp. AZCC_0090]MBB6406290.1 acyl dehydratase [Arthrobacter sp. AZCC_0090]